MRPLDIYYVDQLLNREREHGMAMFHHATRAADFLAKHDPAMAAVLRQRIEDDTKNYIVEKANLHEQWEQAGKKLDFKQWMFLVVSVPLLMLVGYLPMEALKVLGYVQ